MSNMLSITVDLSSIIGAQGVITREIFPRLREAVGAVAQEAQNRWADSIMKAPGVWYVEKQEYVGSLKWEYTGEFEARVFSDYKKADWIENGRPSIDLKYMLNTSMKVRTSKKGKRYLIIPFRHNTTGNGAHARAMPANIYAQAKELTASRITGHGHGTSRPSSRTWCGSGSMTGVAGCHDSNPRGSETSMRAWCVSTPVQGRANPAPI